MSRVITNDEAAEKLGLTHSAVSRIRRGERLPSLKVILRIADEFGLPVEDLARAAVAASEGDREPWIALMDRAFTSPDRSAA